MNIIIYGTKKCQETKKAERYFSERKIPFQKRDIAEVPLTEGELSNVTRGKSPDEYLDTGSKRYITRGLAFMEYNPLEEILSDPLLLSTPVIRLDNKYYIRPILSDLPV